MTNTMCDMCGKIIEFPTKNVKVVASGGDNSNFDMHPDCWFKVLQFISRFRRENK
jgi:hypothetical protein